MKTKTLIIVTTFMLILLIAASAAAIPNLQLDILNGTYNHHSETIVATSDPFTLFAYLIPDSKAPLDDTYYISAAIVPKTGPSGKDLGSFIFDGLTSSVTASMVYGNPPLETAQDKDPGDLQKHGIFPTYFIQFAFQFDKNNEATAYDTADEDHTGQGPTPNPSGAMYYESFSVDTSNLADHYFIHFDLYNTKTIQETQKICSDDTRKCGEGDHKHCFDIVLGYDVDIKDKAPFSHDAQSGEGCDHHKVPEPGMLSLLGSSVVGLAFFAWRRVKQ